MDTSGTYGRRPDIESLKLHSHPWWRLGTVAGSCGPIASAGDHEGAWRTTGFHGFDQSKSYVA